MRKTNFFLSVLLLFISSNCLAQRPYEFDILPKVNGKVKRIFEYSNKAVYNPETKQLDIKEYEWYFSGYNKIYDFNTKKQVTSMTGLRANNDVMGKQIYSYNSRGLLIESKIVKKKTTSNVTKYSYNTKNQLIKVVANSEKVTPTNYVLSYEKGKLRKQVELDKTGKEKNKVLYEYVGDSVIIYNKFEYGRKRKLFTLNTQKLVKNQVDFLSLNNDFIGTNYYYTYDKKKNWIRKVLAVVYAASEITEYYVISRKIEYFD